MSSRSILRRIATPCLLAGMASLALADDPVQEWHLDIYPKTTARSAVDSQDNLAAGGLHHTEKYAPDGTLLWYQDFWLGTNKFHTDLMWLVVDSQDNVIRGGYQEAGGGAEPGYLAVKYDSEGVLLWYSLLVDLPGQAFRCELDEFDNIYLFGEITDKDTGGPRWLTVKLDPDGQMVWHRLGHFGEPVDLEVRDGQVVGAGHVNGGDWVTTSYDYDGNVSWENTYQPGTAFGDMAIGADGQVVLCGWGSAGGTDSAGSIVQYDALGNEEWATLYNGPYGGIELFTRLAIDDTGAVIAVGYGLSSTPSDAWSIVKLDPSGTVLWTQLYDNVAHTGWEYAYSVTVGTSNSIYVGGLSDRNTYCGYGSLEGHVVKYSADGDYQWHHHLECGGYPTQILFDSTDALYAVPFYEILRLREQVGDTYCAPAVANSTGLPAVLLATGSRTVGHNQFTLTAEQLPPGQFGYFLTSETQDFVSGPGGSQGNLCLGGSIGRFAAAVQNSGPAGTFSMPVDLEHMPMSPPQGVLPGETWNFQAWFRDKNPNQTSNFTDAVSVAFQ